MNVSFPSSAWSGLYIRGQRGPVALGGGGQAAQQAALVDFGRESLREHAALHREFACAAPSADGIKAFLAACPDLGAEALSFFVPSGGEPVVVYPLDRARTTPDEDALREMLQLRRCVRLWDLVQQGDQAGLGQYLRRREREGREPAFVYHSHPRGERPVPPDVVHTAVIVDIDLTSAAEGDLRPAARAYLGGVIEQKLRGQIDVHLSDSPGRTAQMRMHLIPRTLLAALWLQFAEEVTGGFAPSECRMCNRWFRPTKHGDRVYCRKGCMVTACRKRKTARAMEAEGRPMEEIARKLRLSEGTVKWLLDPAAED